MLNLSAISKLRLPLWSTTRCVGMVGPFKQFNQIEVVESMTGLLTYMCSDSPYSDNHHYSATVVVASTLLYLFLSLYTIRTLLHHNLLNASTSFFIITIFLKYSLPNT